MISRRIAKPAQNFFPVFLRRQVAPSACVFPYATASFTSASPAPGNSAVDHFDLAAAFLRLAGTTAVRAAGSLAGAPRVGGVDETGCELQGGSLFRSWECGEC